MLPRKNKGYCYRVNLSFFKTRISAEVSVKAPAGEKYLTDTVTIFSIIQTIPFPKPSLSSDGWPK